MLRGSSAARLPRALLRLHLVTITATALQLEGRGVAHMRRATAAPPVSWLRTSAGPSMEAAVEEAPAVVVEPAGPMVLPTNEDSDHLLRIRHTSAHVMAMAVQRLFKDVKVTIGPWIDKGFYYDFDTPADKQLEEKDLKKIKKEMDKIIQYKLPLVREEVSKEEAERRIRAQNEPYKLELLESIVERDPDAPITIYHIGEPAVEDEGAEGAEGAEKKKKGGLKPWWDLCAGPHVEHTGMLPKDAIQLESIAGAYWRGDESRPMLQRIYGTAWETAEQLEAYAVQVAEAKRRDHRVLGKALDLFSIQQDAGAGLVFWHPKGACVRNLVENYWKDVHTARGYELLVTPHMANVDLWKTSGHFDFYKDGMFDQMEVEGADYQLKPMNCPFHVLIFKDKQLSYRDLPKRWAEMGTVYRYERSGTLQGLFRVRGFTQDDAHIFCLPEQLTDEILGVLDLTEEVLSKFGFTEYEINLSTRPEKSVGSDDIWDKATDALVGALGRKGWEYTVDEGGGAFYGPKIDVKIRDAIGRMWQCSTIQCDFNLPQRFDLQYVAASGEKEQPIMLHRAIFGSLERFMGVLIESTAGDFPYWLAPTQLRLLPVSDDFLPFCDEVREKAKAAGLRVEVDPGGRSLGKQIKVASAEKVAVFAVVGKDEVEGRTLSLKSRKGGDLGTLGVDEAVARMAAAQNTYLEPHEVIDVPASAAA